MLVNGVIFTDRFKNRLSSDLEKCLAKPSHIIISPGIDLYVPPEKPSSPGYLVIPHKKSVAENLDELNWSAVAHLQSRRNP